MADFGRQVMLQRAGATQITINNEKIVGKLEEKDKEASK
jgi:hypothetical protein